jgi:hypothetical protein
VNRPHFRNLGRAVAHRWPALLGAALVTAAMPIAVGLAAETFGESLFESSAGVTLTALNNSFPNLRTAFRASSYGTAIEANGSIGVDAFGGTSDGTGAAVQAKAISGTGVDASSAKAIAVKASGQTVGLQARAKGTDQSIGIAIDADGNKTGVKASSFEVAVDASSQATGVKSFGSTTGVRAISNTSTGVNASGRTAVKATGQTTGVNAAAQDGVAVSAAGNGEFGIGVGATGTYAGVNANSLNGDGIQSSANGTGIGVAANSRDGLGVAGHSTNGLGAEFSGGKAPIRLVPSGAPGAPTSGTHKRGELYVDSQGTLFLCVADSVGNTAGTWRKVHLD